MKITRLFLMLLLMGGVLAACEGPEGPAGPQGQAGDPGNANVQVQTYTVSNWVYNQPSYWGDIAADIVTADIVGNGAVLVYIETAADTYSQLPVTFYPSSSYSSSLEMIHAAGFVRILWTDSDLTQPNLPGTRNFKVVTVAGSQKRAEPNLDWSDYNAVKERFNLPE